MAFVPQGQQLFGTMTVDENLHVDADRPKACLSSGFTLL